MNSVDRTPAVLQPFHANRVQPDRRRKNGSGQPFDLEGATTHAEPEARAEVVPVRPLPSGGDEGVGEHVNIVV